jgi:hypothetical protein
VNALLVALITAVWIICVFGCLPLPLKQAYLATRLYGLDLENRWKIGPFAHTCASVVGIAMEPSVVGRDWSPVSSL